MDVVEIGSKTLKTGGVYSVKALGAYAMIDEGALRENPTSCPGPAESQPCPEFARALYSWSLAKRASSVGRREVGCKNLGF